MSRKEFTALSLLFAAMSIILILTAKTASKDVFGACLFAYGCIMGWAFGRIISINIQASKSR